MYDSGPGIMLATILFVDVEGHAAEWLPAGTSPYVSLFMLLAALCWMLALTRRGCRNEA